MEAGPLLEPHNGPGRNQAGGSRVSDAYAHGGSGTAAFAGVCGTCWNLRWPKDVYHAAGYERICKGFKLRILGFEVPEKKKEAPLDDEI